MCGSLTVHVHQCYVCINEPHHIVEGQSLVLYSYSLRRIQPNLTISPLTVGKVPETYPWQVELQRCGGGEGVRGGGGGEAGSCILGGV